MTDNPYQPPENNDSQSTGVSRRSQFVIGALFCILGVAITAAGLLPVLAVIVIALILIAIKIAAAVSSYGNRR